MAYNYAMAELPAAERAKRLAKLYTIGSDKASRNTQHFNLGGSYSFTHISRKALEQLKALGKDDLVKTAVSCCKSGDCAAALSAFNRAKLNKSKLTIEHAIPCSVLQKHIESSKRYQAESYLMQLFSAGVFTLCGITEEENQRLNKLGLRQKMPKQWSGSICRDAVLARYRDAEIEAVCLCDM